MDWTDATSEAIREAFYPEELWYGTEIELGSEDQGSPALNAVSVTNTYVSRAEPAHFLLGMHEDGVNYTARPEQRIERGEVVGLFERCASGDRSWVGQFVWEEVVSGRPTGRLRPPAGQRIVAADMAARNSEWRPRLHVGRHAAELKRWADFQIPVS